MNDNQILVDIAVYNFGGTGVVFFSFFFFLIAFMHSFL